jgi:hypothetical protein
VQCGCWSIMRFFLKPLQLLLPNFKSCDYR